MNSFVTVERAYAILRGVKFNKKQTKRAAKYVIICLCFLNLVTWLHEPFNRQLIEEKEEENQHDSIHRRSWCVLNIDKQNIFLKPYNSFINILHYCLSFCLNLTSASIILLYSSRKKSIGKNENYVSNLKRTIFES